MAPRPRKPDSKTAIIVFAVIVAVLIVAALVGYFTGAWETYPPAQ